ncbi:Uncharacterized protein HZ326_22209 [Fusarium oxysporum f. sp. albedinis]|nr:Uncharacterized protein HZ326_22209 [Fusarium oxysporum f. sp. albedinis]
MHPQDELTNIIIKGPLGSPLWSCAETEAQLLDCCLSPNATAGLKRRTERENATRCVVLSLSVKKAELRLPSWLCICSSKCEYPYPCLTLKM